MSKETTENRGGRQEGNGKIRKEKGAEKTRKTSRNKESKRNPFYPLHGRKAPLMKESTRERRKGRSRGNKRRRHRI